MIRQATIMRAIAERFQTPAYALRSPERRRALAEPRFGFMFLARRAGHSFPEIGRYLSRDHTTIIHGCRRARKLIKENARYAERIYEAWEMVEASHAEDLDRIRSIRAELLGAGAE